MKRHPVKQWLPSLGRRSFALLPTWVGLAGLVASVPALAAQEVAIPAECRAVAEGAEPLDTGLARLMPAHDVPGVAVAVVRDGEVALLRGYGCHDLAGTVPVDPEQTRFRVASVSKVFVAATAMSVAAE